MQAGIKAVTPTKFARQAADLDAVYLYKEGLFARAYNEGAYGFIQQVMACKPIRRLVKSAGVDRVVCGVPLATLMKLPGFGQASQLDALTWRWPLDSPVDPGCYAAWRESLPVMMPNTDHRSHAPAWERTPGRSSVHLNSPAPTNLNQANLSAIVSRA